MALSKIRTEGLSVGGGLATSADLALVAFDSIRADNRSALKMDNAFVDQFEDATGIDTTSSCRRNAGSEHVAAVDDGFFSTGSFTNTVNDNWNKGSLGSWTFGDGTWSHSSSPDEDGGPISIGATTDLEFAASTPFEFTFTHSAGTGYGPFVVLASTSTRPTDNSGNPRNVGTWALATMNNLTDALSVRCGSSGVPTNNVTQGTGSADTGLFNASDLKVNSSNKATIVRNPNNTFSVYDGDKDTGTLQGTTTFTNSNAMFIALPGQGGHASSASSVQYRKGTASIANAAGNFTSATQAAPSNVSKVSIVIMYEDSSGTASLNTDLVAQVSADAGSNFSTVTLSSAPNLSSTIKVAKSEAVAVTAGNQPKYKISFANQSSGSKVTRVLGVSLLY